MPNIAQRENMSNGVIVLGSARSDGHTRMMVERLVSHSGMSVIDLNDYAIGYFEYDNYDRDDDFIPLMDTLLKYDLLVFASPVYWYNMSAIMKNFFDRVTDLLRMHKELGRQFRSKSMAVLSCSATSGPDEQFAVPFRLTADYLGMEFRGHVATWMEEDRISEKVDKLIREFLDVIVTARNF
jgi:multimeric flavodoxin WrbA